MNKYYVENISINNIINSNKSFSIYIENLILTESGFIKIIKDNYVNFILKKNVNTQVIEDFLDNSNLYIQKSPFIKDNIVNCIPVNHKKIKLIIHKYKFGKINFVIEYIDNKIRDYYFTADKNLDITNIQKNIIRFIT
tara:strand:- start:1300 stop:1713 length:414 start_codon:yes stop_codon:yes gene_type:complete